MSAVISIYQAALAVMACAAALPAGAAPQPAPEPAPAPARSTGFGQPVPAAHLLAVRGTGGLAVTTDLGGTVHGNSAQQMSTGANIIQASSFAGASGMPVVIQNSGANVLIQNATVINLELK